MSLATHRAEVVSLAKQVLEACAFGSEAKVLDERTFDRGYTHPVLLLGQRRRIQGRQGGTRK